MLDLVDFSHTTAAKPFNDPVSAYRRQPGNSSHVCNVVKGKLTPLNGS
jgi:hypothetical protein